ncbi:MAG: hypothetical protein FWD94_04355 [Treponema sp.]|nr:hypothetical protein [Treponema sp.]
MAEQKKSGFRDGKAPGVLTLIFADAQGKEWGRMYASQKEFSTGSVGYNATGKIVNPENPDAKYQVGANITLVGSKP